MEGEETIHRIRHEIAIAHTAHTKDTTVEQLRRDGIQAAKEYIQGINDLLAAFRDDSNATRVIGTRGQQTLDDLNSHVRELTIAAEQRKTTSDELLLVEGGDGGNVAEVQLLVRRVFSEAHGLTKLISDINKKQQVAIAQVDSRNRARRSCVDLMAAFLIYYGILPRFVLLIIARIQLRLSLGQLRPSLTSPYFSQIISNLKSPPHWACF